MYNEAEILLIQTFYAKRAGMKKVISDWKAYIEEENSKLFLFRDYERIKFGKRIISEYTDRICGMFDLVTDIVPLDVLYLPHFSKE